MLAADHLHVHVLVVVLVQRCRRVRVAQPEVYGIGGLGEGDAGEGDGGRDVGEERGVFVAEVVVFYGGGVSGGWAWAIGERGDGRVCA